MKSPCTKNNDKACGGACTCPVRRMFYRLRDKIKNPYAWFLILWLGGLMTVLAASSVIKLLIFILKKTVNE